MAHGVYTHLWGLNQDTCRCRLKDVLKLTCKPAHISRRTFNTQV